MARVSLTRKERLAAALRENLKRRKKRAVASSDADIRERKAPAERNGLPPLIRSPNPARKSD
jgi:hypothetical protein